MKKPEWLVNSSLALFVAVCFTGCEQKIMVESIVHDDGSIDRTVVLYDVDSGALNNNIYGLKLAGGWVATIQRREKRDDSLKNKRKFDLALHKTFTSAAEANAVMNDSLSSDTLLRINSNFETQFRWFYTYIKYSDTYVSINRFQHLAQRDYFTDEDYAFIRRIPALGVPFSKADSLFHLRLREKITDHYATRAIYEEYVTALKGLLRDKQIDTKWNDSLQARKEELFRKIVKTDSLNNNETVLSEMIKILRIPVEISKADEKTRTLDIVSRVNFMSSAMEGKFTHIIQMPFEVVRTNADSISGNQLVWKPPVIKFMLNNYTMYAESRTMNYWAVGVTFLAIIGVSFAFFRRK